MLDIIKIFKLQTVLDKRIEDIHVTNECDKEKIFKKKILSLLVELGELSNETRCFKFWSTKNAGEKARIADEFADCLHFIVSLGISTVGFSDEISEELKKNEIIFPKECIDLTDQFIIVYKNVHIFAENRCLKEYYEMFSNYLKLGRLLGLTYADMEESYIAKNIVNHKRQDAGY